MQNNQTRSSIKRLIRVLTIDSTGDLFRYKSFFLLIFGLLAADRFLHRWLKTPGIDLQIPQPLIKLQTAAYVFTELPQKLVQLLLNPKIITVTFGLFLLKQIISLWPSSDMRRMHRRERGRFGIMEALAVLRWHQVAYDAVAVGSICAITALWFVFAYTFGWCLWHIVPSVLCLILTAVLAAAALPLTMAGFSFSSKIAVISQGRFREKLRLFFYLFTDWQILWSSWVFFNARILIEMIFVALIPASAMLMIHNFGLRIMIAAISATPVYSYLKMASFKFFLETYSCFTLVRQEYSAYFGTKIIK